MNADPQSDHHHHPAAAAGRAERSNSLLPMISPAAANAAHLFSPPAHTVTSGGAGGGSHSLLNFEANTQHSASAAATTTTTTATNPLLLSNNSTVNASKTNHDRHHHHQQKSSSGGAGTAGFLSGEANNTNNTNYVNSSGGGGGKSRDGSHNTKQRGGGAAAGGGGTVVTESAEANDVYKALGIATTTVANNTHTNSSSNNNRQNNFVANYVSQQAASHMGGGGGGGGAIPAGSVNNALGGSFLPQSSSHNPQHRQSISLLRGQHFLNSHNQNNFSNNNNHHHTHHQPQPSETGNSLFSPPMDVSGAGGGGGGGGGGLARPLSSGALNALQKSNGGGGNTNSGGVVGPSGVLGLGGIIGGIGGGGAQSEFAGDFPTNQYNNHQNMNNYYAAAAANNLNNNTNTNVINSLHHQHNNHNNASLGIGLSSNNNASSSGKWLTSNTPGAVSSSAFGQQVPSVVNYSAGGAGGGGNPSSFFFASGGGGGTLGGLLENGASNGGGGKPPQAFPTVLHGAAITSEDFIDLTTATVSEFITALHESPRVGACPAAAFRPIVSAALKGLAVATHVFLDARAIYNRHPTPKALTTLNTATAILNFISTEILENQFLMDRVEPCPLPPAVVVANVDDFPNTTNGGGIAGQPRTRTVTSASVLRRGVFGGNGFKGAAADASYASDLIPPSGPGDAPASPAAAVDMGAGGPRLSLTPATPAGVGLGLVGGGGLGLTGLLGLGAFGGVGGNATGTFGTNRNPLLSPGAATVAATSNTNSNGVGIGLTNTNSMSVNRNAASSPLAGAGAHSASAVTSTLVVESIAGSPNPVTVNVPGSVIPMSANNLIGGGGGGGGTTTAPDVGGAVMGDRDDDVESSASPLHFGATRNAHNNNNNNATPSAGGVSVGVATLDSRHLRHDSSNTMSSALVVGTVGTSSSPSPRGPNGEGTTNSSNGPLSHGGADGGGGGGVVGPSSSRALIIVGSGSATANDSANIISMSQLASEWVAMWNSEKSNQLLGEEGATTTLIFQQALKISRVFRTKGNLNRFERDSIFIRNFVMPNAKLFNNSNNSSSAANGTHDSVGGGGSGGRKGLGMDGGVIRRVKKGGVGYPASSSSRRGGGGGGGGLFPVAGRTYLFDGTRLRFSDGDSPLAGGTAGVSSTAFNGGASNYFRRRWSQSMADGEDPVRTQTLGNANHNHNNLFGTHMYTPRGGSRKGSGGGGGGDGDDEQQTVTTTAMGRCVTRCGNALTRFLLSAATSKLAIGLLLVLAVGCFAATAAIGIVAIQGVVDSFDELADLIKDNEGSMPPAIAASQLLELSMSIPQFALIGPAAAGAIIAIFMVALLLVAAKYLLRFDVVSSVEELHDEEEDALAEEEEYIARMRRIEEKERQHNHNGAAANSVGDHENSTGNNTAAPNSTSLAGGGGGIDLDGNPYNGSYSASMAERSRREGGGQMPMRPMYGAGGKLLGSPSTITTDVPTSPIGGGAGGGGGASSPSNTNSNDGARPELYLPFVDLKHLNRVTKLFGMVVSQPSLLLSALSPAANGGAGVAGNVGGIVGGAGIGGFFSGGTVGSGGGGIVGGFASDNADNGKGLTVVGPAGFAANGVGGGAAAEIPISNTAINEHLVIIGADANYRITLWNAAAERVSGYRFDEVQGQLVNNVIDEKALDAMKRILNHTNTTATRLVTLNAVRVLGKNENVVELRATLSSSVVRSSKTAVALCGTAHENFHKTNHAYVVRELNVQLQHDIVMLLHALRGEYPIGAIASNYFPHQIQASSSSMGGGGMAPMAALMSASSQHQHQQQSQNMMNQNNNNGGGYSSMSMNHQYPKSFVSAGGQFFAGSPKGGSAGVFVGGTHVKSVSASNFINASASNDSSNLLFPTTGHVGNNIHLPTGNAVSGAAAVTTVPPSSLLSPNHYLTAGNSVGVTPTMSLGHPFISHSASIAPDSFVTPTHGAVEVPNLSGVGGSANRSGAAGGGGPNGGPTNASASVDKTNNSSSAGGVGPEGPNGGGGQSGDFAAPPHASHAHSLGHTGNNMGELIAGLLSVVSTEATPMPSAADPRHLLMSGSPPPAPAPAAPSQPHPEVNIDLSVAGGDGNLNVHSRTFKPVGDTATTPHGDAAHTNATNLNTNKLPLNINNGSSLNFGINTATTTTTTTNTSNNASITGGTAGGANGKVLHHSPTSNSSNSATNNNSKQQQQQQHIANSLSLGAFSSNNNMVMSANIGGSGNGNANGSSSSPIPLAPNSAGASLSQYRNLHQNYQSLAGGGGHSHPSQQAGGGGSQQQQQAAAAAAALLHMQQHAVHKHFTNDEFVDFIDVKLRQCLQLAQLGTWANISRISSKMSDWEQSTADTVLGNVVRKYLSRLDLVFRNRSVMPEVFTVGATALEAALTAIFQATTSRLRCEVTYNPISFDSDGFIEFSITSLAGEDLGAAFGHCLRHSNSSAAALSGSNMGTIIPTIPNVPMAGTIPMPVLNFGSGNNSSTNTASNNNVGGPLPHPPSQQQLLTAAHRGGAGGVLAVSGSPLFHTMNPGLVPTSSVMGSPIIPSNHLAAHHHHHASAAAAHHNGHHHASVGPSHIAVGGGGAATGLSGYFNERGIGGGIADRFGGGGGTAVTTSATPGGIGNGSTQQQGGASATATNISVLPTTTFNPPQNSTSQQRHLANSLQRHIVDLGGVVGTFDTQAMLTGQAFAHTVREGKAGKSIFMRVPVRLTRTINRGASLGSSLSFIGGGGGGGGGSVISHAASVNAFAAAAEYCSFAVYEPNAFYRHAICDLVWSQGQAVMIVETFEALQKTLRSSTIRVDCIVISVDDEIGLEMSKFLLEPRNMRDPSASVAASPLTVSATPGVVRTVIGGLGGAFSSGGGGGGGTSGGPSAADRYTVALSAEQLLTADRVAKIFDQRTVKTTRIHTIVKPFRRSHVAAMMRDATLRRNEAQQRLQREEKNKRLFQLHRNAPWTRGDLLGKGAYGDVYEALNTLTRGKMAVKEIRTSIMDKTKEEEFANEIAVMCELTHPNIVQYFYCEKSEKGILLFMELCDGGHLGSYIAKHENRRLPMLEAVVFTRQLVSALGYLHSMNFAHRDIKPENVLLTAATNELKLTDFGTAARVLTGEKPFTETAGTMRYMAPEVFNGEPYGTACDVWSVGILVMEMLGVGVPWLDGKDFFAINEFYTTTIYDPRNPNPIPLPKDLTGEARDFVAACLHADQSNRALMTTLAHHPFLVKKVDDAYGYVSGYDTKAAAANFDAPLRGVGDSTSGSTSDADDDDDKHLIITNGGGGGVGVGGIFGVGTSSAGGPMMPHGGRLPQLPPFMMQHVGGIGGGMPPADGIGGGDGDGRSSDSDDDLLIYNQPSSGVGPSGVGGGVGGAFGGGLPFGAGSNMNMMIGGGNLAAAVGSSATPTSTSVAVGGAGMAPVPSPRGFSAPSGGRRVSNAVGGGGGGAVSSVAHSMGNPHSLSPHGLGVGGGLGAGGGGGGVEVHTGPFPPVKAGAGVMRRGSVAAPASFNSTTNVNATVTVDFSGLNNDDSRGGGGAYNKGVVVNGNNANANKNGAAVVDTLIGAANSGVIPMFASSMTGGGAASPVMMVNPSASAALAGLQRPPSSLIGMIAPYDPTNANRASSPHPTLSHNPRRTSTVVVIPPTAAGSSQPQPQNLHHQPTPPASPSPLHGGTNSSSGARPRHRRGSTSRVGLPPAPSVTRSGDGGNRNPPATAIHGHSNHNHHSSDDDDDGSEMVPFSSGVSAPLVAGGGGGGGPPMPPPTAVVPPAFMGPNHNGVGDSDDDSDDSMMIPQMR